MTVRQRVPTAIVVKRMSTGAFGIVCLLQLGCTQSIMTPAGRAEAVDPGSQFGGWWGAWEPGARCWWTRTSTPNLASGSRRNGKLTVAGFASRPRLNCPFAYLGLGRRAAPCRDHAGDPRNQQAPCKRWQDTGKGHWNGALRRSRSGSTPTQKRKPGERPPAPLGLTVGESLDRTCGERPRASRIVLSPRVRPIICAKSSPFDSQRAAAPIGRTDN